MQSSSCKIESWVFASHFLCRLSSRGLSSREHLCELRPGVALSPMFAAKSSCTASAFRELPSNSIFLGYLPHLALTRTNRDPPMPLDLNRKLTHPISKLLADPSVSSNFPVFVLLVRPRPNESGWIDFIVDTATQETLYSAHKVRSPFLLHPRDLSLNLYPSLSL